jgi:hypothetical protein
LMAIVIGAAKTVLLLLCRHRLHHHPHIFDLPCCFSGCCWLVPEPPPLLRRRTVLRTLRVHSPSSSRRLSFVAVPHAHFALSFFSHESRQLSTLQAAF